MLFKKLTSENKIINKTQSCSDLLLLLLLFLNANVEIKSTHNIKKNQRMGLLLSIIFSHQRKKKQ